MEKKMENGGPYNKDYSILGSILGSSNFGKDIYINIRIRFRV